MVALVAAPPPLLPAAAPYRGARGAKDHAPGKMAARMADAAFLPPIAPVSDEPEIQCRRCGGTGKLWHPERDCDVCCKDRRTSMPAAAPKWHKRTSLMSPRWRSTDSFPPQAPKEIRTLPFVANLYRSRVGITEEAAVLPIIARIKRLPGEEEVARHRIDGRESDTRECETLILRTEIAIMNFMERDGPAPMVTLRYHRGKPAICCEVRKLILAYEEKGRQDIAQRVVARRPIILSAESGSRCHVEAARIGFIETCYDDFVTGLRDLKAWYQRVLRTKEDTARETIAQREVMARGRLEDACRRGLPNL